MKRILFTLALILPLAACETNGPFDGDSGGGVNNQQAATVVGGIVGGVLGSQVGGGSGQIAATIGGALLGGLLGSTVGASLDRSDEERAYQALENNRINEESRWRNDNTDSEVIVTPTRTYTGSSGQYCREYDTEVIIDGDRKEARGTACRQDDGSWQVVS